jgi:methyl-accepting chemotaxis protein
MDKQVIKDYEILVKTGEQYSDDSIYVDEMTTDISATSEELLASIESMIKTINEVSNATNESAAGTMNIASKTIIVIEKVSEVTKFVNSSKESSESLIKMVEQFKV